MSAGIPDDAELVQRAQAGDETAFDALVERHTPRLYRVVRRMASDAAEAEVFVQEAWLRAWRALPGWDAQGSLFPWLARIAMNVARDAWRKLRPLDFADLDGGDLALAAEEPSPEQWLEREQALEVLSRAVGQLRPEERAVIALRYDGGLAYEQIAQALQVPVNTVRTHLHRAKAALRRAVEAEDG